MRKIDRGQAWGSSRLRHGGGQVKVDETDGSSQREGQPGGLASWKAREGVQRGVVSHVKYFGEVKWVN